MIFLCRKCNNNTCKTTHTKTRENNYESKGGTKNDLGSRANQLLEL